MLAAGGGWGQAARTRARCSGLGLLGPEPHVSVLHPRTYAMVPRSDGTWGSRRVNVLGLSSSA